MQYFNFLSRQNVLALTNIRRFETKTGEIVKVAENKEGWMQLLNSNEIKYVVFGIPEDIGVKANFGKGGADSAWRPFLSAFLNLQSNDFFKGENVLVAGAFDFSDFKIVIDKNAASYEEKVDAYRHAVLTIDDAVEEICKLIVQHHKIPVIIGGGHNNSYPLIKGTAKGLLKAEKIDLAQIHCVNFDAHTDFRPVEGRHSGNGFRYAEEDGYLEKYFILGVQESYLQQNIWLDIVINPFADFISYEDIFIRNKFRFKDALVYANKFIAGGFTGIELDLDVIENTVTSAISPSGVHSMHARQYVSFFGAQTKAAYLHIAEGAAALEDGQKQDTIGKLIALLVADFIKAGAANSI